MLRRAFLPLVFALAVAAAHAQAASSIDDGPISTTNPDVTLHPRTPDDSTLNNDAIIRMTKAGLSEQIIAQAVQLQPGRYDTGPQDLIALKQAGVADKVVSLMMSHGAAETTGATGAVGSSSEGRRLLGPAGSSDTRPVNLAPLSASLDEMGVYYQDKTGEWTPLKSEKVVIKSGGWIKSAVTDGLIKQDRNGTVNGEHSPLVLNPGTQLMIYAPEGTDADEYTFLQFREHGNRREFRVFTGGVFHGQGGSDRDAIEFKAKKVATRMYSFHVPEDIVVGEYGVLPPGAAGAPSLNGNGKMYTFRVIEATNAPKKP